VAFKKATDYEPENVQANMLYKNDGSNHKSVLDKRSKCPTYQILFFDGYELLNELQVIDARMIRAYH
jgi:hypothetical protein